MVAVAVPRSAETDFSGRKGGGSEMRRREGKGRKEPSG